MKILIVGCGKVGYTLAKTLTLEKHDITLVDKDEQRINKITTEVDCMGVVGSGAIQSVLMEAQVDKTDCLIACTDSDEINILTCMIARKCSECKTIARIRNPEYAKQIKYIMNELDISTTINPEQAAAIEIIRILRYSSSISSDSFFKGNLNLIKCEVFENSPIIGLKLFQIANKFNCNVLICVIERNDEIIIPSGNTVILEGDKICFVADHNNVMLFFNSIGFTYKPINSFMIIGAGKISQYLISALLKFNPKYRIKLIESEREKCREFASLFPEISVVCADATDKNMLIQEGMNDVDSFIALTGIDEENIILSLFAGQNKKTKIISKINHLNFIDSLKEIEIGSIINPERIAANIILTYVRAAKNDYKSNIESLYRICDEKVEALGFKIKQKSEITNIKLKDLKIKKNIILAGIYRSNNVIIPKGSDEICIGDSVVVISYGHVLKNVIDILDKDNEH